ncbi:hypothetical protein C7M84_017345 [Penaeus vannamei]|uniref:Uncharacterized protein n=1 Tax=Penaeus vannamei TaxID=6689 RepID=A0A3R7M1J6_PENVA|nr:hypothetical protein C7M84_017345 [Penaeus vannamei]
MKYSYSGVHCAPLLVFDDSFFSLYPSCFFFSLSSSLLLSFSLSSFPSPPLSFRNKPSSLSVSPMSYFFYFPLFPFSYPPLTGSEVVLGPLRLLRLVLDDSLLFFSFYPPFLQYHYSVSFSLSPFYFFSCSTSLPPFPLLLIKNEGVLGPLCHPLLSATCSYLSVPPLSSSHLFPSSQFISISIFLLCFFISLLFISFLLLYSPRAKPSLASLVPSAIPCCRHLSIPPLSSYYYSFPSSHFPPLFLPSLFSSSPFSSSTHRARSRPWSTAPSPAGSRRRFLRPLLLLLIHSPLPASPSFTPFPSSLLLPPPPSSTHRAREAVLVHCAFPCWFSTTLSYLSVPPPSSSFILLFLFLLFLLPLLFSLLLLLLTESEAVLVPSASLAVDIFLSLLFLLLIPSPLPTFPPFFHPLPPSLLSLLSSLTEREAVLGPLRLPLLGLDDAFLSFCPSSFFFPFLSLFLPPPTPFPPSLLLPPSPPPPPPRPLTEREAVLGPLRLPLLVLDDAFLSSVLPPSSSIPFPLPTSPPPSPLLFFSFLLLLLYSPSAKPSLVHCAFPCWFSTTHLSRTSSPSVTSTLSGFTRNFCSCTAPPAKGTLRLMCVLFSC